MTDNTRNVLEFLCDCSELRGFCSQGGSVDTSNLEFEFIESEDHSALVHVEFDEVVARGPARIAAKVPCFGRLRLFFDESGGVESARVA